MRKTLIAAIIVACGLGGQAYAQKEKSSVMTVSLTRQYEYSTNFTASKLTWKTKSDKVDTKAVIAAIGVVLDLRFSSSAQLVVAEGDFSGFFANWEEIQGATVVGLPNGYHRVMDLEYTSGSNYWSETVGEYPAGLWQINGQVFIKDGAACINVTPFFKMTIAECYDCFYLNSFVTDSTFTLGKQEGPPCCSPTFTLSGSGKDKYYVTLEFDNTINNCAIEDYYDDYLDLDIAGLDPYEDGVTPNDNAEFNGWDTKVMRWRVGGIVTYSWSLKLFNSTDPHPRFVGSASQPVYGYGYIAKTCAMITGTISVSEKLVDASQCCFIDWNEDGVGWDDPYNDNFDWPIPNGIRRENFNGTQFPVILDYDYDEWTWNDRLDKFVTDHWWWSGWYGNCWKIGE